MSQYDLKKLKLLASGGEANIYEIDAHKVLRVIYKKESNNKNTEENVYPLLEKNRIHVPQIYEYLTINDQKAQLMERINGKSLLGEWIRHPFAEKKQMHEFAGMHAEILRIMGGKDIPSLQDTLHYFVTNRQVNLCKEVRDKIMLLFDRLPAGDNLCHGDFHPGNILVSGETKTIIDWSGVHTGNPISDVAHTYLLMTCVPKIPGQSKIQYFIMHKAGTKRANEYKKEMKERMQFGENEFEQWLMVMSLFRIYCGLPSEKEERIKYIIDRENIL